MTKLRFNVFMFNLVWFVQKLIRLSLNGKAYPTYDDKMNVVGTWNDYYIGWIAYKYFSKNSVSVTRTYKDGFTQTSNYTIELMPYGEHSVKSDNYGYMGMRSIDNILKVVLK